MRIFAPARSYEVYARGTYVGRFRMSRRVARRQRKAGWIIIDTPTPTRSGTL